MLLLSGWENGILFKIFPDLFIEEGNPLTTKDTKVNTKVTKDLQDKLLCVLCAYFVTLWLKGLF